MGREKNYRPEPAAQYGFPMNRANVFCPPALMLAQILQYLPSAVCCAVHPLATVNPLRENPELERHGVPYTVLCVGDSSSSTLASPRGGFFSHVGGVLTTLAIPEGC